MKLYTQTELTQLTDQFERTGLATASHLILEVENFGECLTTITPLRNKMTGEVDELVALYPKSLFWMSEPLYYTFQSDIRA